MKNQDEGIEIKVPSIKEVPNPEDADVYTKACMMGLIYAQDVSSKSLGEGVRFLSKDESERAILTKMFILKQAFPSLYGDLGKYIADVKPNRYTRKYVSSINESVLDKYRLALQDEEYISKLVEELSGILEIILAPVVIRLYHNYEYIHKFDGEEKVKGETKKLLIEFLSMYAPFINLRDENGQIESFIASTLVKYNISAGEI